MERIIDINMLNQTKEDIRKYALYVNRLRCTPNVIDSFKSVQRRIIYAAYACTKAVNRTVKSSAIVGDTIKKFHPHGDIPIYTSMKPMANWFESYIQILNPSGNWGNYQGDPAAAQRYTETNLLPFTMDCVIGELKETKNIVDWSETYDGSDVEPAYLPVSVPLLLINGTFGIGYGLKVQVPAHNINEVIDATIKLIKNPEASVTLIPDQCMPCEIIETNFKAICNKGQGSFIVRGIVEIGKNPEKGNKPAIFIKSTPDLVFLNTVKDEIEKMVENKQLPQVIDITDDSQDDNMCLTVTLKTGSDPNYVRDIIYKHTSVQTKISVNFEVLKDLNPVRMSYKEYLLYFIEFRKMTKYRLYCCKLQQVQTELHEMETYIRVLESGEIDKIIDMIKKQEEIDDDYVIEYLISALGITDLQAKFIIQSNIKKLSIGYLNKYKQRYNELFPIAQYYRERIIQDDFTQDIIDELKEYKKKYGCPRRSRVISKSEFNNIPKGTFKIIITGNNFIKKVDANSTIGSFKDDYPKFVVKIENEDNLILFDELGKVYKLPVHKIPMSNISSNGIDLRTLIKNATSNICKITSESKIELYSKELNKHFISVLTHQGNIKKLDLEDFLSVPPSGILYMKLNEADKIVGVELVSNDDDIIVYSKNKALRMNVSEVPYQKRNSKGMRAITESEVDGLCKVNSATSDLVVITDKGKVNKFSALALPCIGRNKAGSKVIKLAKGDSIISIVAVNPDDIIKVKTKNEVFEMLVSNIEAGSSISTGKKIIPLKNDNIIKIEVNE